METRVSVACQDQALNIGDVVSKPKQTMNSEDQSLNIDNSFDQIHGSTLTFQSINYTLNKQSCPNACPIPSMKKKHKQILYNLTGIFKPGMNAILGPTGSGKSSLLDILADRKDRRGLDGEVLMDGQVQTADFKYRVGYVVQEDILSGTLTVRENLAFSANLRLAKANSRTARATIVDQVIVQLGLEQCADSKVGTEFVRGISGGERKRTNIGMELVLSPSVLFLDEPTTGLDSSTARNVMECLHQLSRRGRTIIFSIHQPRYSIFKLFDTLFLVAAGRCVYHGPANAILPFFASIGFTCEEHDNPADFILDITQGDRSIQSASIINDIDPEKRQDHLARYMNDTYMKSNIFISIEEQMANANGRRGGGGGATTAADIAVILPSKSRLAEIWYVSQRTLRNAFRNPALITMQTIVTIFFATLVGLIYLQIDRSEDKGVKNRMGAIFFIVINQVFANLSAIELFLKERVLFIHENASGYYHVSTYFVAKLGCDLFPLRIIPSILFSIIVYFMIGFQRTAEKFFIFFFDIFLTTICGSALCFFASASVQVFGIANLIVAMSFVLMMVFGGFLVELSSVIQFLSWIKWVSIFRYSSNILQINEFTGLILCLKNNATICPIHGEDILQDAHVDYLTTWDLWKNFVALIAMTVIFFLLTYIQLLRIKKTK